MYLETSGMLSYHKVAFEPMERRVELETCTMEYLELKAHPDSPLTSVDSAIFIPKDRSMTAWMNCG